MQVGSILLCLLDSVFVFSSFVCLFVCLFVSFFL
jgi:hypothetical protein